VDPTDKPLTFAAFGARSFRFQWPADLFTSWAFEMETLILAWYVMVHTGSVFLLTVFGSLQFFGTLAAPMLGVLGDRIGSRTVLCVMRATYVGLALVLAFLGLADRLSTAAVFVVAAVAGIFRPNDLVMRNSLIGDTIPPDHLKGALSMSRATVDSARVAGALAGASLSAALGIGIAYVFVTSFYALGLALTFGVSSGRPVADPSGGGSRPARDAARVSLPRASNWRDLSDGLVHVWTTPRLLAAMWLAFLVNLTAYPVTNGLLPYVARNIYMIEATGLGSLVASFSSGALLGSLALVATRGPRHPERSMIVSSVIWYALVLGFGHVRTMTLGIVVLILTGIVQSIAMISMAVTLLSAAGDRFRGRVMGVRTLAVYGLPLGLMASGALIDRIGFPATVTLYCGVGLIFTVLIGSRWRASLWHA
jgi:predicted MFS family arabinose efflux permease